MQCEVCGRQIIGATHKAIIEGAKLVVCGDCAALGSMSWELETRKPTKTAAKARGPRKQQPVMKKPQYPLESTLELVDDFGARIRQARETKGLSHEELGRKINEKVSVLKKLESHKITPDNTLAEKLQHTLKIRLLVQASEEKVPKHSTTTYQPEGITLGDLIKNKKNPSEATT